MFQPFWLGSLFDQGTRECRYFIKTIDNPPVIIINNVLYKYEIKWVLFQRNAVTKVKEEVRNIKGQNLYIVYASPHNTIRARGWRLHFPREQNLRPRLRIHELIVSYGPNPTSQWKPLIRYCQGKFFYNFTSENTCILWKNITSYLSSIIGLVLRPCTHEGVRWNHNNEFHLLRQQ